MEVDVDFFFHKSLYLLFVSHMRNVLASRPVPYLSADSVCIKMPKIIYCESNHWSSR